MRESLAAITETSRYSGTFERYGCLHEYGIKFVTVLIRNIECNGEIVTDHQWFRINQGFENLQLHNGDIVSFNANVAPYIKGYFGKDKQIRKEKRIELDYQLVNLQNIEITSSQRREEA